jgi:hypothetical protein
MPDRQPFYLITGVTICRLLSFVSAGINYCMISADILKTPVYLLNARKKKYKHLCNIWYTRIVRRMISVLVRSPLRSSTLRIVNFNIPLPSNSGCIIVICHTPWKRLLVQWCLEKKFAFIISSIKLTRNEKLVRSNGTGFKELRNIVKYMRLNGRVVLAADIFNNLKNCPVKFLGNYHNASLLPVRLARIAEVPLIVAIPSLQNRTINFLHYPEFYINVTEQNSSFVIQDIISFLETEINKNPSIWHSYVY